jgi:hypothetical protein
MRFSRSSIEYIPFDDNAFGIWFKLNFGIAESKDEFFLMNGMSGSIGSLNATYVARIEPIEAPYTPPGKSKV